MHTQVDEAALPLPVPPTLAELRHMLVETYPALDRALPTMRLAINMSYAADDALLAPGDEVAVIPPVSGGCGDERIWTELFRVALPLDRMHAFIGGDQTCGGIVIFEGVTRAESDPEHGELLRLEYEAYDAMALTEMRRLCADAFTRWSVGKIALLHRLGAVFPTETSVVIAVAAGHRSEAFDACRWLIDTLKRDVPIWKKDVFASGFTRWVEPTRKA